MAFSVSYHRLAECNIRNLYGGLPEQIKWRTSTSGNNLTTAQRNHDRQVRPSPDDRFNNRYYEYDEDNNIRIPKAPAFRQMSRSKVDAIVARLSQPTMSTRRHVSDVCERGMQRSMSAPCHKCRTASAGSRTSRSYRAQITDRLQMPTVSANVRNSMRSWRPMSVMEVYDSCERYKGGSPSERLYKELTYDI